MAFIGALLLTKIWKAVAVTILRRTGRKRWCKALVTHKCWAVLHVSPGFSHLWWIWTRRAWRRLVWPPRTCRASVHPQVRHTQAWGFPSAGHLARLAWSSEEQTDARLFWSDLLFHPSWFFCGGLATLTVSKGTLEIFRGSKISTAAACCFWAWRYFSVVKSSTFMMTQRRVSSGSSADLASATTMAPRHPGHVEKTDVMVK